MSRNGSVVRILLLFLRALFISGFFISSSLWAQGGWEGKANCDSPSDSLKTLKTATQDECRKSCEAEKDCRGIVYVTGWKRCLLKAQLQKQAHVKFISGELNDQHVFEATALKPDHDHSGKDLERKVFDRPEECGQACQGRADCQAFTYIEGYRVCWLKAKGGRLSEKVFHCGLRK